MAPELQYHPEEVQKKRTPDINDLIYKVELLPHACLRSSVIPEYDCDLFKISNIVYKKLLSLLTT